LSHILCARLALYTVKLIAVFLPGNPIILHILITSLFLFNTLASGCFRGFSEKKRLNARGFAREYHRSCSGYRPGRRGKSSSLHSKKFFLLGGYVFLWVTS